MCACVCRCALRWAQNSYFRALCSFAAACSRTVVDNALLVLGCAVTVVLLVPWRYSAHSLCPCAMSQPWLSIKFLNLVKPLNVATCERILVIVVQALWLLFLGLSRICCRGETTSWLTVNIRWIALQVWLYPHFTRELQWIKVYQLRRFSKCLRNEARDWAPVRSQRKRKPVGFGIYEFSAWSCARMIGSAKFCSLRSSVFRRRALPERVRLFNLFPVRCAEI